jgi:hypothetical protein
MEAIIFLSTPTRAPRETSCRIWGSASAQWDHSRGVSVGEVVRNSQCDDTVGSTAALSAGSGDTAADATVCGYFVAVDAHIDVL